jgi:selenocysteine lyase/cysteine desulfurase
MITAQLPLTVDVIRSHYRYLHEDVAEHNKISASALLKWAKTRVHTELLDLYRIEVPVFVHEGLLYVRASCWVYNARADIQALGTAIRSLQRRWVFVAKPPPLSRM